MSQTRTKKPQLRKTLDISKSKSQENQEDNTNSNYKRTPVENTPFVIISTETHAVHMGNYRISDFFATYEQAIEDTKRNDVERICQIVEIVTNFKLKQ